MSQQFVVHLLIGALAERNLYTKQRLDASHATSHPKRHLGNCFLSLF